MIGVPYISFNKDKICNVCQLEKQTRKSFRSKNVASISRLLELLHLDLFGPTRIICLGSKKYGLVVIDDFSRFTWVSFLAHMNKAFSSFIKLLQIITNEKNTTIVLIRSDHGGEFENQRFEEFCNENGIGHNFSAPRTPQQNGVVERKNRTLEEMA